MKYAIKFGCRNLSLTYTLKIHFGSTWPRSFIGILKTKVGDTRVQRKIALEGHRFSPQEALQAGLVDHLATGNTEAIIAKAVTVAKSVSSLAKEGIWGTLKVSQHILRCHVTTQY